MNITASLQTGLIGLNRNYDNTLRSPGGEESGVTDEKESVTMHASEAQEAVRETTDSDVTASVAGVAMTQVVTEAKETTETSTARSALIDTYA